MTTNRQFNLGLDALAKLRLGADSTSSIQPQPTDDSSTIGRALADAGPLPREALFLGVASDGLPVLLNLHDPLPGPMLVIGDEGAGKTAFLQSIAGAVQATHTSDDVQFALITSRLDEWSAIGLTDHLAGMFDVEHDGAQQLINSLAAWAHTNRASTQSVILLVDGLEAIARWEVAGLQHFRWLLLRGPARRVWPIVTLNAGRYGQVIAWLNLFRTRVFGQIDDGPVAEALGADNLSGVGQLEAGRQFTLRENGNWLQFHI